MPTDNTKQTAKTFYRDKLLPTFQAYKLLVLSIAGIIAFSLLYKGYHAHALKSSQHVDPISVSASLVVEKPMTVSFKTIGTVAAYKSVSIRSQTSGQIMQIAFERGQMVQQGQLLFVIDPRPAQAQLEQAKAALAKDQAQLQNAEANLARDKALIKKSFVSQATFDQDQTTVNSQQAAVAADQAAVDNANLQLAYSYITAPIAGRAGDIQVDAGNIIQSGQSTVLTSINQLQPIYINFAIPQDYFSVISHDVKNPTVITAKSGNQVEQGRLSFVDNQIDTNTGTINLKADFANADSQLWPGQHVEVSIPTAHFDKALTVPAAAVQQGAKGSYVFVTTDKVIAKPKKTGFWATVWDKTKHLANTTDTNITHVAYRDVTAGPTVGNEAIILKGLNADEQIITAGQLQLVDGSLVKIVTPTEN